MPVSPVTPIVKPEGGQRRVLLLTSETALEAEVRDALRIRQQEREPGLFFEFTYMDPISISDFLAVLDLLDHVRHGYFDMVHIVPSASTWSRSRHSEHSGQPPLRSRSSPLGLSSLSPDETEKINEANRALEVAVWVAEHALQCPSKFIGLNIIFPEDLGGHCLHGPSSIWVLREFRFLEGIRDARRAAAYMCQFTRSEYKRPIGILSNCTSLRPLLFLGWPNLVEVQNRLKYRGPLPLSCSCGREHTPLVGLTDDATFRTSSSVGFGAEFWISCVYDDMLERSFVSLRDGDRPDLTPLGDSPLLSPSLASSSTSLRSTYEAWKAGTLTKASMVDIAPSDSIAAYFSAPLSSSLGSSSRSCLCSLWKVFPVSSTFVLPNGSTARATSWTPPVSSLQARSRSPCRMKKPLVLLRPRGDVSSVVTGAPPGSLSARCVVFTVSLCLIIFPLFLSFNN